MAGCSPHRRTAAFGRLFLLLQTNYLNLLQMSEQPDDVWILLSLMAVHSDSAQRFALLAEIRCAPRARRTCGVGARSLTACGANGAAAAGGPGRARVMDSLKQTGRAKPPHPPVVALLEAMGIDVNQLLAYTQE